jgi:hypothetical protein
MTNHLRVVSNQPDKNLMPQHRIQIEWPDNTVDVGMKYVDLFDRVLSDQLSGYPNRKAFKRELARRAKLWADQRMDVNPDDTNCKDFFLSLARTGMINVYEDGRNMTDGQPAIGLVETPPANVTPLR